MRVYYMSDLHVGIGSNRAYVKSLPILGTKEDVLLLAGDIFFVHEDKEKMKSNIEYFDWYVDKLSEAYGRVIIVPGNHEYYGGADIAKMGDSWSYQIRDNVSYEYNRTVRVGSTDFICTTLWTRIDEKHAYDVRWGLNDFRLSYYNGHRLTTDDYGTEHDKCVAFIKKALADSTAEHMVVLTHHVPSWKAASERYKDSPLNSAFNANLDDLIESSNIDYWVYGHSHTNIDVEIGKTKLVSNQVGYVANGETARNGFENGKYFEL